MKTSHYDFGTYGPATVFFHNALADHYDDGPVKSYEKQTTRVEAVRHKMITPHIMLADAGAGFGNHYIIQVDNTPNFEVVQVRGYDPW